MNNLFHLASSWLPRSARDELVFSRYRHAVFMDFLEKPEVFSQNIADSLYEFSDGFLEAFG